MKEDVLKRIERVADDDGWSVHVSDRYNEPDSEDVEFETYTNYGQDLVVSVIVKNSDPWSLIEDLENFYRGYDPDYEASLWIGDDGHGKNGAPYHIKDIVDDMKDAEEKIGDLLEAMRYEFLDYPEEDDEEEIDEE